MLGRFLDVLRRQYLGALALFIVLGGTSYAAVTLEPGSVGSREIRNRSIERQDLGGGSVTTRHIAVSAVTGSRIARDAVKSDEVKDGSLLSADFAPGQLPKGEKGDKGDRGEKGDTGPAGSADTPQEVLDKLKTVDGAGSGLDADVFGGLGLAAFQRRITGTCAAGQYMQTVGADGTVGCGTDANAGGDITSVNAGTGLTGGATSGDATLGVAVPLVLTQPNTNAAALQAQVTNASSLQRVIDVSHSGGGEGVFASTRGNAIHGITELVTAAAIVGDSSTGEVIVGRQDGTNCPSSNCNGIGAVVGRHDGPNGYGVRGFVTDPAGGYGVIGQAGISGGSGTGVRGENINSSNAGFGVEGSTNGAGAGIHGTESSANAAALAGLFDGNVRINGDLTVTGTKTGFRIDDPRDPAKRTLSHTPVETDALTVVYTGNVRTGRDGRATVRLPAYAESIAGGWRYQLTPIGRFGQAIVAREVRDGRFVIRTEHGNTKVSWSVTGVRRDAFARKHPFRAVQDKTGAERSRYLHPELYGKGRSASVIRPVTSSARVARHRPKLASER